MNIQKFKDKKVIIVHGYHASPQSHWFPWLKQQLEDQGATVYIPALPNSSVPDPVEWSKCLDNLSFLLDESTLCIGHSLGCITLLKFLDKYKEQSHKMGGYILVAGFSKIFDKGLSSDELTLLTRHVDHPLDYTSLVGITNHRVSIVSSNDYLIKPELSIDLAKALQNKVIMVDDAGHFLDRDGYKEFPDIVSILKDMSL